MKQTGRTMVEMLAVLAIAGVLTLGGISGIRSAINIGRQMLTEGFYHDIRFSMIEKCMGSGSCPYQDYRTGFSKNYNLLCQNTDLPSAFCKGENGKTGVYKAYEDAAWNMGTVQENGRRFIAATLVNLPDSVCAKAVQSAVPNGSDRMKVGSHTFNDPENQRDAMAQACENRASDAFFGGPVLTVYWVP